MGISEQWLRGRRSGFRKFGFKKVFHFIFFLFFPSLYDVMGFLARGFYRYSIFFVSFHRHADTM